MQLVSLVEVSLLPMKLVSLSSSKTGNNFEYSDIQIYVNIIILFVDKMN